MLEIGTIIAAFTEDQVQRLTKLTQRQLRYWARTGFFTPSYSADDSGRSGGRFYSFKDIVALRTLELLRVQNNVPLQHLRKVAEKLSHLKDDLWTKTTLFFANRKVAVVNPETGEFQEVVSDQYLLPIELKKVMQDTSRDVEAMRRRSDDEIGHIAKRRDISRNAWVIAGTRVPVASVKRLHEDGLTADQIIAEYPDLTPNDVKAAIEHEAAVAA